MEYQQPTPLDTPSSAPEHAYVYNSPGKEADKGYFPEFMAFYFPPAHAKINMSLGYALLDQELHTVVQYAELGKRFFDKLVRISHFSGAEDWIFIHLKVQGSPQTEYA